MEVKVIKSQELLIPFQVDSHVVYFKLICSKCGSTFFILSDDHKKISCEKKDCDAVPLVQPNGFDAPGGMWKI